MIERLLKCIAKGGSFSTQSLATELDVSNELIESMLADLVRAGRLKLVEHCAADECKGCQMASSCKPQAKIWTLVRQ
jgi:DeoR/GlpR family transcriptional regulator of sugar metabolism